MTNAFLNYNGISTLHLLMHNMKTPYMNSLDNIQRTSCERIASTSPLTHSSRIGHHTLPQTDENGSSTSMTETKIYRGQ